VETIVKIHLLLGTALTSDHVFYRHIYSLFINNFVWCYDSFTYIICWQWQNKWLSRYLNLILNTKQRKILLNGIKI